MGNFDLINNYTISNYSSDTTFNRSSVINYLTSILVRNFFSENQKNIILNIPFLNNTRKWILFDFTLNHMKSSFVDKGMRYNKGDCLRITGTKRKIICEFVEYLYYDGIDGECMKINFENVSGFIIKKDMWSFEKVIPQKLSSLSHFQKNEKLFALDKIIDKSSNNNFELFNTSILYVGGVNTTRRFISRNLVLGNPIQKTISWSKSNEDGEIIKLHGNQTDHFNCVITPSLTSAVTTITQNSNQKFNAIFIENLNQCQNDYGSLADLAQMDIPIYIFSSSIDHDSYKVLCENLNFDIIHLGRTTCKELAQIEHNQFPGETLIDFRRFLSALDNFSSKSITINVVQDNFIEKIGQNSIELNRQLSEAPISNQIFSNLRRYALQLSRISSIKCLDINLFKNQIKDIENFIELKAYLIPEDDRGLLLKMIDDLEIFINQEFDDYVLQKETELINLINQNNQNETCVITSLVTGNNKLKKHIQNICHKDIPFYQSSSEIDLSSNCKTVVVTGWAAGKKLDELLLSTKFRNIIFFIYPYQLPWLKSKIIAKNSFFNKNLVNNNLSLFLDNNDELFESFEDRSVLPEPTINLPSSIEIPDSESIDLDLLEFEIKERRRNAFKSVYDSDEVIKYDNAKLVDFYDGFSGVFSEGHKFLNVSSILNGVENSKIKETKTDKLKSGDYILNFETEKGSVLLLTEQKMTNDGLKETLELSKKWSNLLNSLRDRYRSDQSLFQSLQSQGLTVGIATLRNWLNQYIICPNEEVNIVVIGKVMGGEDGLFLSNRVKDILDACNTVKQYRKKIASQLRIAAYETITDKDLSNYIESDKNVIKLEIDIYGEATIYKVEEIDSDYSEYPLSVINKIRGEEI